jgi:hypothetical protein
MAEPLALGARPGTTHSTIAKRHAKTWPLVASLREVARPLALRRPSDLVSPAIHAEAATLFTAVRRVLSREPFPRELLILRDVPDWATLLSRLELAMTGLQAFRARYSEWDEVFGQVVWRDEAWLSFRLPQGESSSPANALEEI